MNFPSRPPRPSNLNEPIPLDEHDLLDDNGDDSSERPTIEFDCIGHVIRNPCRFAVPSKLS